MKRYLAVLTLLFVFGYLLRIAFLPKLSLTFGYDQARDAVAALAISHGDLKILGPSASTPGLYHGVLYFYVLAPAYLIGNGNPIAAALWIAFLNALSILIVFALTFAFTKKRGPALLAAFFFAVSFESTQYATWLSNPTLGVLTVPLFYWGLWNWISHDKKGANWWPAIAALGLGMSIQSEIFLAYHFVPLCIWLYVARRQISSKEIVKFGIVFLLSLSTMILSEFKFGFKGVGGVMSLLSTTDAIVASKGLGDFIILFFNQIGRVFAFSSYPGNIGYGFAIVILCLIFLTRRFKKENNKISWIIFLSTWLFSHLSVVTMGGTSTPFLLVGIAPAVSIVLGIAVFYLYEKVGFISIFLAGIIIFGNLKMIITENPKGQTIFAIQKDMLLSKQLQTIDYTYMAAQHNQFSINTLTSPLWVNIVWAYLYDWYGMPKYGYVPSFHGHGQEGQVIALSQEKTPQNINFLIIEPMAGIPLRYLPETISEEDSKSVLKNEVYFGEIRIQERRAK